MTVILLFRATTARESWLIGAGAPIYSFTCLRLLQRIEFNGRDLGPGEIASLCANAGGSQAEDSEAALVTFESEEGASTALLLSNSLLEDRPIFLVTASPDGVYIP